jgi:hypothetical protein
VQNVNSNSRYTNNNKNTSNTKDVYDIKDTSNNREVAKCRGIGSPTLAKARHSQAIQYQGSQEKMRLLATAWTPYNTRDPCNCKLKQGDKGEQRGLEHGRWNNTDTKP